VLAQAAAVSASAQEPADADAGEINSYVLTEQAFAKFTQASRNLGALGEIYDSLKSRNPQIALLVVGEGPERKQLADRGTSDMVFTGSLHGDDLLRVRLRGHIRVSFRRRCGPHSDPGRRPPVCPDRAQHGRRPDCIVSGETGFVVDGMAEFEKRLEERSGRVASRTCRPTRESCGPGLSPTLSGCSRTWPPAAR
jgi:hypothetical protein